MNSVNTGGSSLSLSVGVVGTMVVVVVSGNVGGVEVDNGTPVVLAPGDTSGSVHPMSTKHIAMATGADRFIPIEYDGHERLWVLVALDIGTSLLGPDRSNGSGEDIWRQRPTPMATGKACTYVVARRWRSCSRNQHRAGTGRGFERVSGPLATPAGCFPVGLVVCWYGRS